jgi:hypothetical protein
MPLGTIAESLTYSRSTVYQVVEELVAEGLLVKARHREGAVVEVAGGYAAQKLREVHVLALKHGVDPEMLLRESTRSVWRAAGEPRDLGSLVSITGLSQRWVRSIVQLLAGPGLIRYIKRRPLVVVRSDGHPLGIALDALEEEGPKEPPVRIVNMGYEDMTWTPEEIERALHELGGSNIFIRGTGFQVRGGAGPFMVVESLRTKDTLEALFLRRLGTPEGIEDLCVRLVASGKLDYSRLLRLSRERGLVNIVGCYLDILSNERPMVSNDIITSFERYRTNRRRPFFKPDRRYGKEGWEGPYERRWNVDLYVDIGAIQHTVRSL